MSASRRRGRPPIWCRLHGEKEGHTAQIPQSRIVATLPGDSAPDSILGMSVLNLTPLDRMTDSRGRPCFPWDSDLTLSRVLTLLKGGDRVERADLVGKLMRQAKPDDVFEFVSLDEIRDLWPDLEPDLGKTRPFWTWLLEVWKGQRAAW